MHRKSLQYGDENIVSLVTNTQDTKTATLTVPTNGNHSLATQSTLDPGNDT